MVTIFAENGAYLGMACTPQELRLALMVAHKLGEKVFTLHGTVNDRKYAYVFTGEKLPFDEFITRLQEAM